MLCFVVIDICCRLHFNSLIACIDNSAATSIDPTMAGTHSRPPGCHIAYRWACYMLKILYGTCRPCVGAR